MTTSHAIKYSERLGVISDAQIQKALSAHSLGDMISAEPITQGLFGQNLFVNSTSGKYVLRGKQHYDWQFPTEQFFAQQLHEHTAVPVPFPYVFDPDTSIFGWPYVIMPKLPGRCLQHDLSEKYLTNADRRQIAQKQGELLAETQKLTWYTIGKYDLAAGTIVAPRHSYSEWMQVYIEDNLTKASTYNDCTPASDIAWVQEELKRARAAMDQPFTPTFVMQDYKPNNMNAMKIGGEWAITGLFDLMECYFGNGESDLARMWSVYVEASRMDLAYTFLAAYIKSSGHQDLDSMLKRLPVYILRDKALIWEWAQRSGKVWWKKNLTFREWVAPNMKINGGLLKKRLV